MGQGTPLSETLDVGADRSIPVRPDVTPPIPDRVGRYRIERLLGSGGFGLVFLAHDEQLNRPVAVKVPHAGRMTRPEDAELYLAEARAVASLEHPHIVPVYDVGSSDLHPLFVVSKYVEGADLATILKGSRFSWRQAAELVASVAEALHCAHKRGLVHRDIKPANILIDLKGKPYVLDFGLAMREEDAGRGPRFAGTPAYMSPEQARCEGHRVDGRSDLFSLGVVFYELLVHRVPFQGNTTEELLEQIATRDSRPPRQCDETIPRELERICLKALSKRASERYTTAHDFAEDLRHFLSCVRHGGAQTPLEEPPIADHKGRPFLLETSRAAVTGDTRVAGQSLGTITPSEMPPVKVVPKGLRSFDAHDADFFLGLLPGPRDRDGLPDSIRFWKTRIEETDADAAFAVGLIYGPSGCGKSSLLKAGLLPRLAAHVLCVSIEATAQETETRLLHNLRKRCPAAPGDCDLRETLVALRRRQGIADGAKVLIVIDQFEQWLHARGNEPDSDLVQALRQCDGVNVQCLVLVRDDFWMAVTRFLGDLEVELVPGRNIAAVDLFDVRHAKRVLRAFGCAHGILSAETDATSEERRFLDRAVAGLTEDGKVICVRLALFAEMMKNRPWTPAALKEVGGTEGLGVTFLEETFSSPGANPKHRLHQKAARAVLEALLPEAGTHIKGNLRSFEEIRQASGYADRPKDLDELIRILDGELRLITPGDPKGLEPDESTATPLGHQFYQLTHDYLVPSLRTWLTRKQRETRRGRAELRLAELAAAWNARRENRLLPSPWEYARIRLFTNPAKWTAAQRRMMRRATRALGIQSSLTVLLLIVVAVAAWGINGQFQARSLVRRLIAADIAEVPNIVGELESYRRWADPLLAREDAQSAPGSSNKLRVALGLLPTDAKKVAELRNRLPVVSPGEFIVVRDSLVPYQSSVTEPLWAKVLDPNGSDQERFQAGCALATYAPGDPRWSRINRFMAAHLVTLEASPLVAWREALRPAKAQLIRPLANLYRDPTQDKLARSFATETLADYAAEHPAVLFDLLVDGEPFQFQVLFEKLAAHKSRAIVLAVAELNRAPRAAATEEQKEQLARRQANAAVALLRLGNPDPVWRLFKFDQDPRARSYLVHWTSRLGGDPATLIGRLESESDVTIRRALVLALGEFPEAQLSATARGPLIGKLVTVFESDPDPGLHGAVEWLLRKWGENRRLEPVIEKLQNKEEQLRARKPSDKQQWYINTQKETFVIVEGGEFGMGSPPSEPEHADTEPLHSCRIGRRLAIAAHEVTRAQWSAFERAVGIRYITPAATLSMFVRTDDSPQTGISWFAAAHYCNWLSEHEGIPKEEWCYEPNPGGHYAAGMKAKDRHVSLAGYRLPTEAEWEYACRAGTSTSRYYGLAESLLPEYAWYQANGQNHTWRVGRLKPNDLGLFDMLGNAWEWCFDVYVDNPMQAAPAVDSIVSSQTVDDRVPRVLRGGAFDVHPQLVRSASRVDTAPANRDVVTGLRPIRTFR